MDNHGLRGYTDPRVPRHEAFLIAGRDPRQHAVITNLTDDVAFALPSRWHPIKRWRRKRAMRRAWEQARVRDG